jgi:hypothetical protein
VEHRPVLDDLDAARDMGMMAHHHTAPAAMAAALKGRS